MRERSVYLFMTSEAEQYYDTIRKLCFSPYSLHIHMNRARASRLRPFQSSVRAF